MGKVTKELFLLLSLFAIAATLQFFAESLPMALCFYFLPTLYSAYFFGRRHATLTAFACIFVVVLLNFVNGLRPAHATLTLPGIAGVILTVGMGVDSNVLIFERIREELRAGKTAAAAVQQGFAHAWVTIIDTHVTTIVSAAILFLFGTGPVRGFALTLVFGLLANLFTAVFVSRMIFDAILQKKERGAALSI